MQDAKVTHRAAPSLAAPLARHQQRHPDQPRRVAASVHAAAAVQAHARAGTAAPYPPTCARPSLVHTRRRRAAPSGETRRLRDAHCAHAQVPPPVRRARAAGASRATAAAATPARCAWSAAFLVSSDAPDSVRKTTWSAHTHTPLPRRRRAKRGCSTPSGTYASPRGTCTALSCTRKSVRLASPFGITVLVTTQRRSGDASIDTVSTHAQ